MLSEQDRELADQRAEAERNAGIDAICRKVAGVGQEAWLVSGKPGPRECTDCDEPISPARLQAAPFAQRCIHCQTARERPIRGKANPGTGCQPVNGRSTGWLSEEKRR